MGNALQKSCSLKPKDKQPKMMPIRKDVENSWVDNPAVDLPGQPTLNYLTDNGMVHEPLAMPQPSAA